MLFYFLLLPTLTLTQNPLEFGHSNNKVVGHVSRQILNGTKKVEDIKGMAGQNANRTQNDEDNKCASVLHGNATQKVEVGAQRGKETQCVEDNKNLDGEDGEDVETAEDATDISSLSDAIVDFSERFYAELSNTTKGNFVFSPLSLHSALTLLSSASTPGSRTQQELFQVLSNVLNLESMQSAYSKVLTAYKEGQYNLNFANQIWLASNYSVSPTFANQSRRLDTGVENLDFADQSSIGRINKWISNVTQGKIQELVSELDPATRLVFANALYLKENWTETFSDLERSEEHQFSLEDNSTVALEMMEREDSDFIYGRFHFGSSDFPHEILRIPYMDSGLEMQIILPNKKFGLGFIEHYLAATLKSQLPRQNFRLFKTPKEETKDIFSFMYVKLPKFKAQSRVDAVGALQNMGLKACFSEESELGALLNPGAGEDRVRVDKVVHEALVSVDAEGTEAAAATLFSVVALSANSAQPIPFIVDRPFMYVIYDRVHDIPVLIGRMKNPLQA